MIINPPNILAMISGVARVKNKSISMPLIVATIINNTISTNAIIPNIFILFSDLRFFYITLKHFMPCAAALGINVWLDGTACYGVPHLIYKGIAFLAHYLGSPCCTMISHQPLERQWVTHPHHPLPSHPRCHCVGIADTLPPCYVETSIGSSACCYDWYGGCWVVAND